MNWFDYQRGYEEGSYDRNARTNTGLLGSLIQLAGTLIMVLFILCWYACKTVIKLLGWLLQLVTFRNH